MNIANDRSLIQLAAQGDQSAFGKLVQLHQSAVFNVAYRMLGNRRDAEDAAQEAFVRAYKAFNSFDTERPVLPWLKKIVTNLCLNRIKAHRPTLSLENGLPPPKESKPGPEAQTANRERDAQVRAAILSLPPRYRAVIELRHFQDLNYEEIAEALSKPISTVKSDLFRARKMLAEKLKEFTLTQPPPNSKNGI
ncbi:MAG: sigma-70 family RNA polymerase sigma factor [Anaerolineae bacterium]|jgi:RNA polymerase sigma-70 factor, ECF subfamily|nr:sigma-70 family RNA polymerase sigma factor [Anaerolineae bacterium]MBT7069999.1 sigma-70 family RNA polymerase sigma factor [Anaerolineae bacterium]MBT7325681.1 sigma-70 family RNA polymerase sigma factor [Anaerolineae bacterium]